MAILLFLLGGFLPMLQSEYPEDVVPNATQAWMLRKQGINFDAADPTERNYVRLAAELGLYGALAVMAWPHRRRMLALVQRNPWLLALVGFALLSCAWSEVPGFSLRRFVWMVVTGIFGLYFALFSLREQVRVLQRALLIAAVLSAMVVAVLPAYGVDHGVHYGALRGIFSTKNALGHVMALGGLVTLAGVRLRGRLRTRDLAVLAVFMVMLLLSRSMTGVVTFVVVSAILWLVPALRSRRGLAMATVLAVIAAAGLALFFVSGVGGLLAALGRDTSLSGRTDLWSAVYAQIQRHPWAGWGFSGFWLGWQGPSANVWATVGWGPPHAHNGYLDLWLQLGVIGLAIFVLTALRGIWRGLSSLQFAPVLDAVWPVSYMVFLLLYNFSETAVLKQDSYSWALFVAAVASVAVPRAVASRMRTQSSAAPAMLTVPMAHEKAS